MLLCRGWSGDSTVVSAVSAADKTVGSKIVGIGKNILDN